MGYRIGEKRSGVRKGTTMRNFVENKSVMSQLELSVHSRLHNHAGVPWPEALVDAKPCFKNSKE